MQHGDAALRAALTRTSIDKVEDVMENITETMDQADELSEALSNPIGPIMDEVLHNMPKSCTCIIMNNA